MTLLPSVAPLSPFLGEGSAPLVTVTQAAAPSLSSSVLARLVELSLAPPVTRYTCQ